MADKQRFKPPESSFLELWLIKNPLGSCLFPQYFTKDQYTVEIDRTKAFNLRYEPIAGINYYHIDFADVYADNGSINQSTAPFSGYLNVHQDSHVHFGNLKSIAIPKGAYRVCFPTDDRSTYSKFRVFF